jgi:Right handed beta helix region
MPRFLGLALTAAVAATMLLAVSAGLALASHVHCGDVLTQDTTLDSDLINCGSGVSVGANDITLDLNGHVVDGVTPPEGMGGAGVDNFANYSGLTVENGTIQQFGRGLLTGIRGGARDTLVQDVTFRDNSAAVDGPLFDSRIAGNAVFGTGFPGFNLFGDNIEVEGNLLSRSGAVEPGFNPVGILLRGLGPFTVSANRVRGYGDGIWATEAIQEILIARNSADRNASNGIRVDTPAATVTGNHTWFNGDLGIEAVPGVTGSKNWSKHNGDRRQCVNVSCSTKGKPKK